MKAAVLRKPLALDTNVLLLYLASLTELSLLESWDRVASFSGHELQRLNDALRVASSILTTPHVLTEASNFLRKAPPHLRNRLHSAFLGFISQAEERQPSAKVLAQEGTFEYLGLTDTALVQLSHEAVIITVDGNLIQAVYAVGGQVYELRVF